MSLMYKLRRAKWLAMGLKHGGLKDFRVIGLAFVKRFEAYSGMFDFHAWAIPSKQIISKPKLVIAAEDSPVFIDSLEWSFDQEACDYEGANSRNDYGLTGFYSYSTNKSLRAFIEFETEQGIHSLELGTLPPTTQNKNAEPAVTNPWAFGQLGNLTTGHLMHQQEYSPQASSDYPSRVDIIIPIYNGFEYLGKLFSTVVQTEIPCHYILIDDCSPDERVALALEAFQQLNPTNCTIIKNKSNLGFVKSVNIGLAHSTNNVVLINTDIELPRYWLERLIFPIINDRAIASVTPMTNSGTICSFPRYLENNELPESLDVAAVDRYFSLIRPTYPKAPTGVGFCMAMSRVAIDAIGFLDSETFGKGYGEENDWCQRAQDHGFNNVICDNLFVYHKHGGSFPSEEKKRLNEENIKKLSKKHPQYLEEVAAHCACDPLGGLRSFIHSQIKADSLRGPSVAIYAHLLGGGASYFHRKKRKELLLKGKNVIMVYYSDIDGLYHVVAYPASGQPHFQFCTNDIYAALSPFKTIERIYVNELATYPKLNTALDSILLEANRLEAEIYVYIHDFLPLCPNLNLLTKSEKYCGLPHSIITCQNCYVESNCNRCSFAETITEYRKAWGRLLSAAQKVIVFSSSSKLLVNQIYPMLENISVEPHSVDHLRVVNTSTYRHAGIHIGIIGNLSAHKGLAIVECLLEEAAKRSSELGQDIRFTQFGNCPHPIKNAAFYSTGEYSRDALPSMVESHEIDIFLLPSIWPETFSFTCSEIIDMGIPAACFDLGAPAERMRTYEKGLVLPYPHNPINASEDAPAILDSIIQHAMTWRSHAI